MANPSLPMEQLSVGQWEPYAEDLPQATPDDAIAALVKYLDLHGTNVLHTSTQIMIVPGYKYKIVEMLITNFHQPKSTLLLLVSAFTKGHWRRIYDYALAHDFRFLSYGDSSLLMPWNVPVEAVFDEKTGFLRHSCSNFFLKSLTSLDIC